MMILGIETSCDETSAAVVETDGRRFTVRSNIVSSQIKIHQKYGGVVPEVAARNHVGKILPVVEKAIKMSGVPPTPRLWRAGTCQVSGVGIDRIAVTVGPGLITSLLVGVETAKVLSYVWKVPVVPVNHLAGHIYSNWLPASKLQSANSKSSSDGQYAMSNKRQIAFPAICLIVSGGHTELVVVPKHGTYRLVGQTLDDAAGEAFDKIAKMLDLGYPGGPIIDRLAAQGNPHAVEFPRAWLQKDSLDFSFSGLKTSVLYYLKKCQMSRRRHQLRRGFVGQEGFGGQAGVKCQVSNVCASVQQAIVDVLVAKTVTAAKRYKMKTVMLGGGVAANRQLRHDLGAVLAKELPRVKYAVPALEYTTDNAAMIAAAGAMSKPVPWKRLTVDPNLSL